MWRSLWFRSAPHSVQVESGRWIAPYRRGSDQIGFSPGVRQPPWSDFGVHPLHPVESSRGQSMRMENDVRESWCLVLFLLLSCLLNRRQDILYDLYMSRPTWKLWSWSWSWFINDEQPHHPQTGLSPRMEKLAVVKLWMIHYLNTLRMRLLKRGKIQPFSLVQFLV